jgi:pyrroloquinoline quinone biosynthesis protein B
VGLPSTSIVVLGTIQDGGSPHIGCKKDCCRDLFEHPDESRQVVALGLYDAANNKRYLFEATPDFSRQTKALKNYGAPTEREMPDGIFLTHAHIGHYTGLMYLGKEARGAKEVPVYAMPKMKTFLENNGPWSQLVSEKNIALQSLTNEDSVRLSEGISVTPLQVPHRDEFSETVGYRIAGPEKTALFIPDIDKWEKWEKDIIQEINKVDYAFLDATFYSGAEIGNRDISLIPHPFISESLEKFGTLSTTEKQKVIFIHFNHTNPVIDRNSPAAKRVLEAGFRIAEIGEVFEL